MGHYCEETLEAAPRSGHARDTQATFDQRTDPVFSGAAPLMTITF
jgi:hypothetical protein